MAAANDPPGTAGYFGILLNVVLISTSFHIC